MTPRCPVTGYACSTAYGDHRCRCAACVAYNSARSDARRRKLGAAVQLRKQKGVTLCPRTGKTPPTSYRAGCRCAVCARYANLANRRDKARRHGRTTAQWTTTDDMRLWREAEAAFMADPGYMIRMAKDAADARELENFGNSR